jgi:hypothetical protein
MGAAALNLLICFAVRRAEKCETDHKYISDDLVYLFRAARGGRPRIGL